MRVHALRQIGQRTRRRRGEAIPLGSQKLYDEIREAARIIGTTIARCKESDQVWHQLLTDPINYAPVVLIGRQSRPENSYRCVALVRGTEVRVRQFGEYHHFAVDADGNIYYRQFYRDWRFRQDVRIWRLIKELEYDQLDDGILRTDLLRPMLSALR